MKLLTKTGYVVPGCLAFASAGLMNNPTLDQLFPFHARNVKYYAFTIGDWTATIAEGACWQEHYIPTLNNDARISLAACLQLSFILPSAIMFTALPLLLGISFLHFVLWRLLPVPRLVSQNNEASIFCTVVPACNYWPDKQQVQPRTDNRKGRSSWREVSSFLRSSKSANCLVNEDRKIKSSRTLLLGLSMRHSTLTNCKGSAPGGA